MSQDEQLQELMLRIRSWHIVRMRRYKRDLPEREYYLAWELSNGILTRAKQCFEKGDLQGLQHVSSEVNYYIEPWAITVWYAMNTKKKKV